MRWAPSGGRIIRSDSRAQLHALHQVVYGCDDQTHRSTALGNATACIAAARVEVDGVRRGSRTLLDSGTVIIGSSLRLRGSMLSWRHASATRTAPLS